MAIYIQSCGISQDNDYRWLKINQNEAKPENPQVLLQSINNLSIKPIELIDSQKSSIILLSLRNDYCLLVTGLRARKERTDFMGRPIRNSVLWICQKDNENLKIRSLVIQALRGELDSKIDKTIINAGEYGFEVNYDSLKELSNSTLAIGNSYQTNSSFKIGKNCDSLREELALELESSTLPDKEGLLIVVTSIKSAYSLQESGVWRGLSNRVESEEFKPYSSLAIAKPGTEKKTLWLGIAISMILLIAIALIIIKLTTPQQPQPQINPSSSSQKTSFPQNLELLEQSINCIQAQENNYFLSPCSWNASKN